MFCIRGLYVILVGLLSMHLSVAVAWQEALSQGEVSKAIELAEITTSPGSKLSTSAPGADRTTLQQTTTHALAVSYTHLTLPTKA